ncbi:hypothetical protein OIU78_009337 [Salix suchowensis]|nr:hypothetical protein OIU78_009337 [Salix suchowensis]
MALFNTPSSSLLQAQNFFTSPKKISPLLITVSCSKSPSQPTSSPSPVDDNSEKQEPKRRLSKQSSWEAKDSEGKDYLYRLGKEADNMNIAVGARAGVVDSLFAGNFLGKDSDIVFDYRQKVTRSFEYLQGDYYIAPLFLDKVVCHIVKNYLAHLLNVKVPLILGIWGGKGQGKSFQTELIFQTMGVEPVIMSAGELESERAGEPGKLIRERYRTASQVVQNQGKMSCLMINDIDAGLGRFGNTQMTVNNQIVVGTLMNLSDNPTRVSIGQDWRESDITNRVPIIVTGNDLSTIYAPLIRDGRMDKFFWQPNREDIVNIVHRMYEKDGISRDEVVSIVNRFPNQALDFYGALRSRTYDRSISKWVDDIGGIENLGKQLLRRKKDEKLPVFTPPEVMYMNHNSFFLSSIKSTEYLSVFRQPSRHEVFLPCVAANVGGFT